MPSSTFHSHFALSWKDVEGTLSSSSSESFGAFEVFKMVFECCCLENNSWVSPWSFLSFLFLCLFKHLEIVVIISADKLRNKAPRAAMVALFIYKKSTFRFLIWFFNTSNWMVFFELNWNGIFIISWISSIIQSLEEFSSFLICIASDLRYSKKS